jgi:hypothetical protein
MSSLTLPERRKLEKFFDMKTGWVLNMSDRAFAELVAHSAGLNIFDLRYNRVTGSRANRLRAFWDIENDSVVGGLLKELVDYAYDGVRRGALAMECRQIVARLVQSGSDVQPRAQMAAESKSTLGPKLQERLAAALNDVMRLAPKPRGFAFEQFLNDLFGAFKLAPRPPFRLVGEQIDGSFHLANETYLVEAKWQDPQIGNRELQAFAGTVRTKAMWSRGLYISYSGFSEDGLIAFGRGDATRIICLDGLDLWQIIDKKLDLSEVLSLKTRRAAETGRAFSAVRDLFQVT